MWHQNTCKSCLFLNATYGALKCRFPSTVSQVSSVNILVSHFYFCSKKKKSESFPNCVSTGEFVCLLWFIYETKINYNLWNVWRVFSYKQWRNFLSNSPSACRGASLRAAPACRAQPGFAASAGARASGRGWWCVEWAWPPAGSARTPAAGSTVCPGGRGRRTLRPDGASRGGGGPTPPCRRLWGRRWETDGGKAMNWSHSCFCVWIKARRRLRCKHQTGASEHQTQAYIGITWHNPVVVS